MCVLEFIQFVDELDVCGKKQNSNVNIYVRKILIILINEFDVLSILNRETREFIFLLSPMCNCVNSISEFC